MIIIFGSATPMGLLLGWIATGSSKFISGFFIAIAAGTFIYVCTVEIIVEEF